MHHTNELLALISSRKPRHSLPGECYLDPDLYKYELQEIWYKQWLFAGHSIEISKPGMFFTFQLGDYPVIILRNRNNEIRAFHNVCRHRGSKLCAKERGKTINLICPYHQWSYDLTGKLFHARSMSEDINLDDYPLKSINVEVVNSQIYICVAEQAPDFKPFRNAVSPFIEPYNLDECKVAHESTQIEHANWKLVFENNRECYHCHKGHPELNKSFIENNAVAGVDHVDDPELVAFWDHCEAAGMPSRLHIANDGQYRMSRVALSKGALSYTIDGKPAASQRIHNKDIENTGALLYFHYPSTWNHYLGDHMVSFRMLPLGINKTQLSTKWLVHKDSVEGVDYDVENLTKVWSATNIQDKAFVEAVQEGVTSPSYQPGPFSSVEENGVCQFVDWYCDHIAERLNDA